MAIEERAPSRPYAGMIAQGVIYGIGVWGLANNSTKALFLDITPLLIFLSVILSLGYHGKMTLKFLGFILGTITVGYLVSLIAVKSGILYGSPYKYNEHMGFKILGVPLLMGLIWFALVYSTSELSRLIFQARPILGVPFATLAMTLMGFVMIPAARSLEWWVWFTPNRMPGMQYYVVWAGVSLSLCIWYRNFRPKRRNRVAASMYVGLLLFFTLYMLFA